MTGKRIGRAADTARAACYLAQGHWLFRVRGQRAVAQATRRAMAGPSTAQAMVDDLGIDAWHTARAVWRAKHWLPFQSTCLQTALATHALFAAKGVRAPVRVGVDCSGSAHAWVEVGDFVLDDQRLSNHFSAFSTTPMKEQGRLA